MGYKLLGAWWYWCVLACVCALGVATTLREMGLSESVNVLNAGDMASGDGVDTGGNDAPVDAQKLAADLQKLVLGLHSDHITDNGVDYAAISKDAQWEQYVQKTRLLQRADLTALTKDHLKAFFINLYNALTIHALVASGASSPIAVSKFWSTYAYNIGGLVYSLDDIEHGCLRGNHAHPSSKKVAFGEDDERRKFIFDLDPRVHFALVCGAKSCPAVRIYNAKNLERGLESAARNFCETEVTLKEDSREVLLSQIFQWYGADFAPAGDSAALVRALLAYKDPEAADTQALQKLLDSGAPVQLAFTKYNWSLNTS